jgi:hypothetical protein
MYQLDPVEEKEAMEQVAHRDPESALDVHE